MGEDISHGPLARDDVLRHVRLAEPADSLIQLGPRRTHAFQEIRLAHHTYSLLATWTMGRALPSMALRCLRVFEV